MKNTLLICLLFFAPWANAATRIFEITDKRTGGMIIIHRDDIVSVNIADRVFDIRHSLADSIRKVDIDSLSVCIYIHGKCEPVGIMDARSSIIRDRNYLLSNKHSLFILSGNRIAYGGKQIETVLKNSRKK